MWLSSGLFVWNASGLRNRRVAEVVGDGPAQATMKAERAMTIEEIMTRDVITVSPTTPIHQAARLMVEHGVSGLPVVGDDGRLVGIISEGDLILRQTRREERPWWRRFFESGEQLARDYQKAVGTTVGEVMTCSVVSISPVWGIETAAAIMQSRRIRRLPVVHDGLLVGIVSRADLIKALVTEVGRCPKCGAEA
jgi:CBS domain-containing protein